MNQKTFNKEMETAEAQGEVREKRGLNWLAISLSLIILIFIMGILATTLLPDKTFQKLNESSNTSGNPSKDNNPK